MAVIDCTGEFALKLVRRMRQHHVGGDNAIHAEELMKYLGIKNDRTLRLVVDHARTKMRIPIVSTFDDGYCIASGYDDEAYQHCVAQRRDVAQKNFKAVQDIESAMEAHYGPPQLF